MNCSKCKKSMITGTQDGKPVYVCLACQVSIQIPQGGPTTQHKLQTRTQTANATPREPSAGEVSFSEAWRELHPSLPFETEYKFSLTRNWEIDFAWVEAKVAVEYEGGGAFGHGRKNRYDTDLAKYNSMAYEGWALFRCTKAMLDKDADRFARMVAETIRRRMGE